MYRELSHQAQTILYQTIAGLPTSLFTLMALPFFIKMRVTAFLLFFNQLPDFSVLPYLDNSQPYFTWPMP